MFDIGFSEIFVIALVALIVIGPERLPQVARTLGHLFGRMQRYVNDVKADISREMELEELRKLQTSVQDAARSIEQSVNQEISTAESQLDNITAAAAEVVPSPPATEAVSPPLPPATEPAAPRSEPGLDASGQAASKQA